MTASPPNGARPGALSYVAILVVLVAGLALAAWQVRRSVAGVGGAVRPVRGQGLVELDQAGSYSLYVTRYASQRMDAAATRAWDTARTAKIGIRDERTGSPLALTNVYETTEVQNTLFARLVEFKVTTPGTFRVQITPSLDELKPLVRPTASIQDIEGEVMGVVFGVGAGLSIGLLAVVVAAIMLFFVLRRRRNLQAVNFAT
jgi:hypothetical protein